MAKMRFRCPECNKKLSATEHDFGRQGECPRCQARFEVTADVLEDAGPEAEVRWGDGEDEEEGRAGARTVGAFELEGFDQEQKQTVEESPPPPPLQVAEPFFDEPVSEEPGPGAGRDGFPAQVVGVPWTGQAPRRAKGYPLLRLLAVCLRVIGGIALAGGTLDALAVAVLAVAGRLALAPVAAMLASSAAAFMAGAVLFAIGELLALLPELRDEARRQTDLLRAILRKLPERGPHR